MLKRTSYFIPLVIILSIISNISYAQPTWTFDPFGKEKKPEQYEEKKLASEKTADKKFTGFRHFVQNNVTHYNYYFNANNKINAVIERAKIAQKDDYSRLLSFYPYSLDNTSTQQVELDSVIYKASSGILLHDLRTDWVDNLYLLIGKSYYLRKKFDSAALTFQFINYNLFPRKKHEDDSRIVGANESASSSILSIANKEKRNFVQKLVTLPPSRNDALIWLARTFTDMEEFGDAAGLINILQFDPNLPKRLRNDLEEVNAYWFYKQNNFDSSAVHLEKALSNADDKQDKSRWQFLLAQMYEMGGQFDKASAYYAKSAKHTVDPLMDIYARLNDAKMFRNNGNTKELQNSIATLLKMAKRDKYSSYRDIIYYSAGQLTLIQPDTTNSLVQLHKSLHYNENNVAYKNKAYLKLADIAYGLHQYKNASSYYDSLQLSDPGIADQATAIEERKKVLTKLVAQLDIISREDSLQVIAAMSAADRDALLKKLEKRLKKEKDAKDVSKDDFAGKTIITSFNKSAKDKDGKDVDLFSGTSSEKGDWYFYNSGLKSRGFSEFKSKWGKRANTDGWRRKSSADAAGKNDLNTNIDIDAVPDAKNNKSGLTSSLVENSFDALLADIPLSAEQMDSSNNHIANAMVTLAKLFQNDLQDYDAAINTYDIYLNRFPDSLRDGEIYLGLYYCYTKLGNTEKAGYYKNLLSKDFSSSKFSKMLSDPASVQTDKKNPTVTARYGSIYNMFIEGNFTEAINAKKQADSLYGNNYWTPQLLYIEAMYYVKEKSDSLAIDVLNNIILLYPASPLKDKASTMIAVLKRRAEIETYLTNLQVTRNEEDKIIMSSDSSITIQKAVIKPTTTTIAPTSRPAIQTDSIAKTLPSMTNGVFTIQPDKPHYILMVLDKVDPVYVNEAKNAFTRYNRQNYGSTPISINKEVLNADKSVLVFLSFADADAALSYYDKLKKAAAEEVSWLQANKYSFLIITENNFQLLKQNKDVDGYRSLLRTQYPGRF